MASLFNKLFCVALSLWLFGPALLAQGQAVPVKTLRWTGRPLKTYGPVETIISETPPRPDDNENCNNDPVTIEAILLLDFKGYPDLVTQREIWVLEDQFVKTFSRLIAQTCDSPGATFMIDDISISPNGIIADMGARRFLTGGNTNSGVPVPVVSYPASVRATCRGGGCPNDNKLFRTNNNSNNNYNRALQGAAGDDKASSSTTNTGLEPTEAAKQRRLAGNCPECTAPTENQFVQAYNSDILEGQLIINLERFVGLMQLDAAACSDEIEEFDADLDIDWISEPYITDEETAFLEQQVVDVYNGLGLMLCDPDFVDLEEAQLIESIPIGDVRRLNLRNKNGERKLAPRRFRNRFRARGRCRGKGCRAKAKRLFDEGVRRLMAMFSSSSGVDHHRILQEASLLGCFCDPAAAADPALQRAPTAEEFTAAYAAVVAEANLPNVFEVLETTVAPPQPTIAPSLPVPPAPTPPPSRRPTPAPAPGPMTTEPSVSSQPSSSPSSEPTSAPTRVPTFAPTEVCHDSMGNDFIFSFLINAPGAPPPKNVELYLTSAVSTQVNIEYPIGTMYTSVFVGPNNAEKISLPLNAAYSWIPDVVATNAVRVSGTDDFAVIMANLATWTSDAALAMPVDALGTEYIIVDYFGVDSATFGRAEFVITAIDDNTEVTINPKESLVGPHPAGTSFTRTLNRGEAYYASSLVLTHSLTGTTISATRPVTVTNGARCTNVPQNQPTCDHIFEVAVPVQSWGKRFAVANLPQREGGSFYRIVAAEDGTEITRNGATILTLDATGYDDIEYLTGSHIFESNKPIFIVQLMTGQGMPFEPYNNGDPSMVNVVPIDQYLKKYTFSTIGGSQFDNDYVTIIAHDADVGTLTLDGVPVPSSSFTAIGSSGLSSAVVELMTKGTHTTESMASGHGITVAGLAPADSYLYSGGYGCL